MDILFTDPSEWEYFGSRRDTTSCWISRTCRSHAINRDFLQLPIALRSYVQYRWEDLSLYFVSVVFFIYFGYHFIFDFMQTNVGMW